MKRYNNRRRAVSSSRPCAAATESCAQHRQGQMKGVLRRARGGALGAILLGNQLQSARGHLTTPMSPVSSMRDMVQEWS